MSEKKLMRGMWTAAQPALHRIISIVAEKQENSKTNKLSAGANVLQLTQPPPCRTVPVWYQVKARGKKSL